MGVFLRLELREWTYGNVVYKSIALSGMGMGIRVELHIDKWRYDKLTAWR